MSARAANAMKRRERERDRRSTRPNAFNNKEAHTSSTLAPCRALDE